ncbi:unnamed protein product [Caenorhabditis bovis]|uniref:ETS domain-containing protein n=1 Tax=Caenorhabditis bovis TaxID=2654633 RepID=A0A8S1EF08_9PELO|nr:unnamed protein product [Caenorhabditis bovis]
MNELQESPALACPAPLIAPAPTRASPWTAALASPHQPTLFGPSTLSSSLPSAFSVVSPSNNTLSGSTIYNQFMCLPSLLESISAQEFIRSSMNPPPKKPIPNDNANVDLGCYRVKDPEDWENDDVVGWLLDLAKSHNIPFEDINMHRFALLRGRDLLKMPENDFVDRDANFGRLIFEEFRKTLLNSEDTTLDKALNTFADDEVPSTSSLDLVLQPMINTIAASQSTATHFNHMQQINQLSQALTNAQASFNQNLLGQPTLNPSLASSLAAGLTAGISPINVGYIHNGLNPTSPLISTQIHQPKVSPIMKYTPSGPINVDYDVSEDRSTSSNDLKIKKNKDGKPRKRSQHTKGNKLWEFIRDALKDPVTCPSVVRWEDPVEGVFRIVESEKLARLWGDRKNNTKMTYEKLSRAMRTYYEKQILVPVPKTGLYPKKLVYKFGPGAHGWEVKREMR